MRFSIPQTGPTALTINGYGRDLVLTPDGSRLVYVGNGGTQLFVRSLDSLDLVPIATGSALATPFISPDGQWVGYLDNSYVMKKVAINGGASVTLPGRGRGGAVWLPDNTIVYGTSSQAAGLLRISTADEANTTPETLTKPNSAAGEAFHLWPEMLPGGQAVLFTITAQSGGLDSAQVAVLDLKTRKQKVVLHGGSGAHYIAGLPGTTGHLVFVAGKTLRAIEFDLTKLETRGSAVPVVPRLLADSLGGGDFTEADDGTLMYVDAPDSAADAIRSLVWVDRTGHEEIAAPPGAYSHVSLSRDGSHVALTVDDNGKRHVRFDLGLPAKGVHSVNFDLGRCVCVPMWTPDGRTIVFQASVAGTPASMWRMPADGSGKAERLIQNIYPQLATSTSPDGRYLVFHEANPETSIDILQMTLDHKRQITPLLNSKSWSSEAGFRPMGAGSHTNAVRKGSRKSMSVLTRTRKASSGRYRPGRRRKLKWSHDSKELFFVAPNLAVMRVAVEAAGSAWRAGSTSQLFDSHYAGNMYTDQFSYAVSSDGNRFLMIKPSSTDPSGTKIVVVQHWNLLTQRLAPR